LFKALLLYRTDPRKNYDTERREAYPERVGTGEVRVRERAIAIALIASQPEKTSGVSHHNHPFPKMINYCHPWI
jgi:hypothetical protein